MQFKSIPFIATVKQSATTQQVANQLQEMLNTQTADGWTFDTIQTVKTIIQPTNGCFGIGAQPMSIEYCSVATFTKSIRYARPTAKKAVESVPTEVPTPPLTAAETVLQTVETVVEPSELDKKEAAVKELDYASIFNPVKGKNRVLETPAFEVQSVESVKEIVPKVSFDVSQWITANRKMLFGVIGGFVALYGVYQFFRPDPLTEAKKAVEIACKCEQDKITQLIRHLSDFNNVFETSAFPTQIEARNAYDNATLQTLISYSNCKNQAGNAKNELRNQFNNYRAILEFDKIYDHQLTAAYKGDENEYQRISVLVTEKINRLKADHSIVVENTFQTPISSSLATGLDGQTGLLTIEPTFLNVLDKPNDEGAFIARAEKGVRYFWGNQYTKPNGVTWYHLEIDGSQKGWIRGLDAHIEGIEMTVTTETTSFHSLNYNTLEFTKETPHLEIGQKCAALKKFKGFIYTEYTNTRGVTTKGWLQLSELKN
jgi:hypothetical protein